MSKGKSSKSSVFFRWIIVVIVVGAAAGGGYWYYNRSKQQTDTASAAVSAMQTSTARIGSIILNVSGTGTLIPKAETSVGFESSGKVSQINVKVGDQVAAGQVLAKLDTTAAEEALEEAKAALAELTSAATIAAAEEAVVNNEVTEKSTRSTLEFYISPDVFKWENRLADAQNALAAAKADLTANSTDTTLQQKVTDAEAAVSEAEKYLKWANWDYESYYYEEAFTVTETNPRTGEEEIVYYTDEDTGELLPLIGAPSQVEIDLARAQYALAKAELEESQNYLAALKGEEIPAGATGSALTQLKNAREAIGTAQENLNAMQLITPIAGMITSLDLFVGEEVGSGNVATVSDLIQPYALEVYLDESDWGNVQVGYEASVVFDILPEQTYSGVVTEINPALISAGSGKYILCTVVLGTSIASPLPSGAAASVDVIGGKAENVVLVPVEALREISDGKFAVFVVEDGEPKLRMVEVGLKDLVSAEITSGLKAGEVVSTGIVETNQ